MTIKYMACAYRDTSETAYSTRLEEIFDTKKEAKQALKNVFADVKFIKETKAN